MYKERNTIRKGWIYEKWITKWKDEYVKKDLLEERLNICRMNYIEFL